MRRKTLQEQADSLSGEENFPISNNWFSKSDKKFFLWFFAIWGAIHFSSLIIPVLFGYVWDAIEVIIGIYDLL